MMRVGVMDDWQGVARGAADWSGLMGRAEVVFLGGSFVDEDAAVGGLEEFDVLIPMRERTEFTAGLVGRLPRLRMIAQTGGRAMTMDLEACTAAGVLVCNTAGQRSARGTAELALGLMLAGTRRIAAGDAAIRAGRFQEGVGVGPVLDGLTLGLVGLGRIGGMMAGYGRALGMRVVAWSPNLTAERAVEGGAEMVGKEALLGGADVVSLHLVLSGRTRGVIGAGELGMMKAGALLVNTSRGPLVDEEALLEALEGGRISAALDVFGEEPLPAGAAIRGAPNTVLTPHLGYGTVDTFRQFYGESIENVLAWLDGAPIRVVNAEVRGA